MSSFRDDDSIQTGKRPVKGSSVCNNECAGRADFRYKRIERVEGGGGHYDWGERNELTEQGNWGELAEQGNWGELAEQDERDKWSERGEP